MRKITVVMGKTGSSIGVIVGLIELSVGTKILSWIGNKENPIILGMITIFLSVIVFVSVRFSEKNNIPTDDCKLAIFLGILLPTTICFTTVGRLWYLPGILLILTSVSLGYEYWFCEIKNLTIKKIPIKFGVTQIIGGTGSLIILLSVVLGFANSAFGLFGSNIIIDANQFYLEVLPVDIIRITKTSVSTFTFENIESQLVMIVYILLILGAGVALIACLVKSHFFITIGGIIIFISLYLFLVCLPLILMQTQMSMVMSESIFESLGIGWYLSNLGMLLILIASLIKKESYKVKKSIV